MKKTGSFSHWKNIFLDQSRMDELHVTLMKYCDYLEIQAKTIDKSSIEFDSYEELMEYTNYKKGRIKRLEICGYLHKSWDRVFTITFCPEYSTKYSVECDYNFEEINKETIFCKEMQDLLDKASSLYIPAFIGKFVSLCLLYLALFFLLSVVLHETSIISYCIGGVVVAIIHDVFLHFIWYILFPPVSFSWGESITYYKHIAKLRNFVFITILLTIAIGILVNYISGRLFTT